MVSLLLAKASFVKKANQASKQAIETEEIGWHAQKTRQRMQCCWLMMSD
jgi:predicted nuclease of restriction endonuclease-like (RecB) superfamily